MTATRVERKPSETALFAALRRALAHHEYHDPTLGPDHLAARFLPPHWRFFLKFPRFRTGTRDKLESALPGLTAYMIARTAYFDQLFTGALAARTAQIVLLGAGYDSRAYRFADQNHGTRIFELDIAPTQQRKRSCLRRGRIARPSWVAFAPIDFNKETPGAVLRAAGWRPGRETLLLWEGVSYYLGPEAVDQTLALVREGSHPQSRIAFDYTVAVPEETLDGYYGAREFTETMRARHAGEALRFSVPEGAIEGFLAARGLRLAEHWDNEAMEREFLPDGAENPPGRVTGHFRLALAGPS